MAGNVCQALVCDELFTRSALFRSLLLDTLDVFLRRAVGIVGTEHAALPGPPQETEHLVGRAVQVLAAWCDRFGVHYPR